MDQEKLQNKIEELIQKVLADTGIEYKIEFENDAMDPNTLYAKLKTTDDNLLIGYHGATLTSLQHIINIMLFKDFTEEGDGPKVIIDVGDYKEDRKKKVLEVADNAIEKARTLQKTIALYPMSSFERKLVHEKVAETEDLVSTSEGEGVNRRVIISFKS